MSMIVEDGSGIYEANSYAGLSYAHSYLHRRNRHTTWDAASTAVREAALIAATDYIDKRFGPVFLGYKKFTDLAVVASNYLNFNSQPTNGNTVTVGSVTITFVNGTPGAGEAEIGASIAVTIGNLLTALASHPDVDFVIAGATAIIARNKIAGEQPDILCSVSSNHAVWDYPKLVGGFDSAEQILEWPREGAVSRVGVPFIGIPEKLRQTTVEYAFRAISGTLMPDPVTSDTGQDVRQIMEKVGPIETETTYLSTVRQIFKKYPEADRLLGELIGSTGGVYR